MTVDIDLWVTATILRELRNNGLITQKEAEKILSRVAKQTARRLLFPSENYGSCLYMSDYGLSVVRLTS